MKGNCGSLERIWKTKTETTLILLQRSCRKVGHTGVGVLHRAIHANQDLEKPESCCGHVECSIVKLCRHLVKVRGEIVVWFISEEFTLSHRHLVFKFTFNQNYSVSQTPRCCSWINWRPDCGCEVGLDYRVYLNPNWKLKPERKIARETFSLADSHTHTTDWADVSFPTL